MPFEIVGAALGRTGTYSTYLALKELGYNPHHMKEVLDDASGHQMKLFLRVGKGEVAVDDVDWNKELSQYDSCVDFPTAATWKAMFRQNSNAKVICTLRDPEKWHESMMATIYPITRSLLFKVMSILPKFRMMREMTDSLIWDGFFEGRATEKQYAIQRYHEYVEDVKRTVPADQLLLFSVRDGWEPLCKFLGKPVPETPFPRANSREEFGGTFFKVMSQKPMLVAVGVAVAAAGAYYWFKSG